MTTKTMSKNYDGDDDDDNDNDCLITAGNPSLVNLNVLRVVIKCS